LGYRVSEKDSATAAGLDKQSDIIYRAGYAWEWLGDVPAAYFDTYAFTATSLYDSTELDTGWQYFIVRAQTDLQYEFYDSAVDSGYSVDNITPSVPGGFAVAYNTGSGNHLTWDPSVDPDFHYFKIYRDTDPDFTPAPGNLVDATADTEWNDPDYDGWDVHYKITTVDDAGNESAAASPGTVTGNETPGTPKSFALYQNMPNPFNPSTVIRYDVPAGGGNVTLEVFDVGGVLIRTLVDREVAGGKWSAPWDGTDTRGSTVASGVYFYRLKAGKKVLTRKMVLLK
jgi:hypothetical protein